MQFLRRTVRITLILALSLVVIPIRVLVWPTALVCERLDRRLCHILLRIYTHSFARILGMKIVTYGAPPKPPFYLVANHLSYLDMLLVTHRAGGTFVARGDVEHWPVIGVLAKSLYIMFIDRTNKRDTVRVNQLIQDAIEKGEGVTVFAESRISRGLDVEPFKSALIEPAVALGLPVHYATIGYETREGSPPASRIIGWWRPEGFFYHVFRLLKYPSFTATIRFGDTPIANGDRKELARQLHESVRAQFVPLK